MAGQSDGGKSNGLLTSAGITVDANLGLLTHNLTGGSIPVRASQALLS